MSDESASSGRRKREGNEADVLVLKARSADEALKARDVLAAVGVELEMPAAAVEVIFAGGADVMEVRVPLEQADAASAAIQEAFGADRLPSHEDAAASDAGPSLSEIEARAREFEEEDRRRREAEAAGEDDDEDDDEDDAPQGESLAETVIYGVIAVVFLIGFVYLVSTM